MWGFNFKTRKSFKSNEYLQFQNEVRDDLLGAEWPFGEEKVGFSIEAAFSNKAADLDNCIKGLLDTYQVVFEEFNDKHVWELQAKKRIVSRGDEYLRVRVSRYEEEQEVQQQEIEDSTEEASEPET